MPRSSLQAWECADEYQEAATEPITWMRRKKGEQMRDKDCAHSLTARRVFANLTRKEYIDLQRFGHDYKHMFRSFMEAGGVMTALYALLFYTNKMGVGDIPGFQAGRWAGCRLELMTIVTAKVWKYTDISSEVISHVKEAFHIYD